MEVLLWNKASFGWSELWNGGKVAELMNIFRNKIACHAVSLPDDEMNTRKVMRSVCLRSMLRFLLSCCCFLAKTILAMIDLLGKHCLFPQKVWLVLCTRQTLNWWSYWVTHTKINFKVSGFCNYIDRVNSFGTGTLC